MWNLCRTCATKQLEMISIFDQDKLPSIAAMITAISSLEILPNDRLPSEICITCFETLEITYYFKQQVTRSNDTLLKQVDRTTLLARCKMLAQPQANNEVSVKSQMGEFVSNEHMIVDSGDVSTENVANHPSECHDPLMIGNDTYDSSKCGVSLKLEMPLTSMACDDMPEEIYINDVNSHLKEIKYKTEINEIDIEEQVAQYGDNCDITPREMISNNVADVDEFCLDNDLSITSVRASAGYNASQTIQDNSNGNAEVTGEASEGELSDVGNLSTDKTHKCTYCNKRFKRATSLNAHMYKHTDGHKCEICQKIYAGPGQLKIHMRIHTGEAIKRHKCDVCGRAFDKICNLKVHMRSHTGERPFHCQQCNSKFRTKSNLKEHMLSHTDERPFHCQLCNSRFHTKRNMKQHMRRHTGEKPFPCQYCTSKFYTKSNWREHMRRHTGEAKPKRHRCEICGHHSDVPSRLKRHMKTHTGEIKYQDTLQQVERGPDENP